MRLVHLVEQHHGLRALFQALRQLTALVVADVPRGSADQLGNLVLLLELGHVQPDEGLFAAVLVEVLGDLLCQLGLADARRAEEEEDEGVVVVYPAVFFPPIEINLR